MKMSKWTDIRDQIVDVLDVEEVTEELKQKITKELVNSILPAIETVAENFTAKLKAQGADETGWCKVRDLVVLPLVINGAIWIIDKVLNKTLTETAGA